MLDTVHLNPPTVLSALQEATKAIGFTMESDPLTGLLLRMLATAKPAGMFLELGTGTGIGTAWIVEGMDSASKLITVDSNESVTAIAKRYLGNDSRITFCTMDGAAFIESQQPGSFDFIFADMHPGKFRLLDETLRLLKPGGLYIIDDLLLQTSWEEAHAVRVYRLVSTLEQRADLHITKFNWSTGIIVAAKRAHL